MERNKRGFLCKMYIREYKRIREWNEDMSDK